ncbi:hypothetical protein [Burkholderia sp. WSM2230]|uniref:hypothetical protein n=1 Tax=Burkholderia sp. WSM2230 TaxID=944435 RepID=UPI0012EBF621|nr:hypothetical protein [Burkholderia sp. WSM2230]
MKLLRLISAVVIPCIGAVHGCAAAQGQVHVGSEVGQVASATGPGTISVEMGDCKFSMTLAAHSHIKFNDPDAIIYRSARPLPENNLPHLIEAPISAGYEWHFHKEGDLDGKWLGLMCAKTTEFPWGVANEQNAASPEMEQVIDANALKCPARPDGEHWAPTTLAMTDTFEELHGPNWSGFVITSHGSGKKNTLSLIRVCLRHNGNVVIGASENDSKPLSIPISYIRDLKRLLSSLRFLE